MKNYRTNFTFRYISTTLNIAMGGKIIPLKKEKHGSFVISLDFELNWGMFDVNEAGQYNQNILGAREVIPEILTLFKEYEIHATWATVGLLLCSNRNEVQEALKKINPTYENDQFNPMRHIKNVGENEVNDPLHFGRSLVFHIKNTPFQEIATHTFSHYYCLENGQQLDQFKRDLQLTKLMHNQLNLPFDSIIFPRNQIEEQYLEICKQFGLKSYRGNPNSRVYNGRKFSKMNYFVRGLKYIDSYVNLFGHHIFNIESLNKDKKIINIPGSMFLRPYNNRFKELEKYKRKRIFKSMEAAAKENKLFHLWWHPHNFGRDIDENLSMLKEILNHYKKLNLDYGFKSYTMKEIVEKQLVKARLIPFLVNSSMVNLLMI